MNAEDANVLLFRRTKIVATLGPASSEEQTILQMIQAGVNVFRLNMSHGSHDEHRLRYDRLRSAAKTAGQEIAVLADLCGPKIRVGLFEHGQIELLDGSTVTVTTRQVTGKAGLIPSQYVALSGDVEPGDRVLLDDGNIELRVERLSGTEIECTVIHGGFLKDKKGMNLPGVKVSAPALTDKDRADALFACGLGVDYIALSFVRTADDVTELRALVNDTATPPLVIAKIEKPEALDHIATILAASDAIMVARGDLGVELEPARVPNVQEELVDLARAAGKPAIVATQMLESMITHARPTRAEVTDVANAVRSGADAVMLSAETAAGAHPLEAVRTMDLVIRRTEGYMFSHGAFGSIEAYTPTEVLRVSNSTAPQSTADRAIAAATAKMSRDLTTSAIIADAQATTLLSALASQRPGAMIFAFASERRGRSLGCLTWGVQPMAESDVSSDALPALALGLLNRQKLEHSSGFILLVTSEDGKRPSLSILTGG